MKPGTWYHVPASTWVLFFFFLANFLTASFGHGQDAAWNNRPQGFDWPTFLGIHQDGVSLESGIRTDWSGNQLPLLWKTEIGEGYSIGSVAKGRYVHFDRNRSKARLRCFDAETGKLIWTQNYSSVYSDMYGYDSGPRTSPVIDGDRVFTFGVEGQLRCWNLDDGSPVWSVDTSKKFGVVQNFFGVGGTPVVVDQKILAIVGGSPAESQAVAPGQLDQVKPNGSAIVAFDKTTGEVVYQLGEDLASYSTIKLTDQLNDRTTGLAFCRNQLIAFDVAKGTELFKFPWRARKLESVNASTPVVFGRHVFLTECYGPGGVLLKIDNNVPKVVWSDDEVRRKSMSAHWNTPVVLDGFAYGSSGQHSGSADFRCIDLKTGELKWRQSGLGRASATLIDNHLLIQGERGELVLAKATPERYQEITRLDWATHPSKTRLKYPCWSAPVVAHGLMWVRGNNQVLCFELIPRQSPKK